jgi:hypothetical protein
MIRVDIQPTPNQTFTVTLADQGAQIALRQNGDELFFDLSVNDVPIVTSRVCRDRCRLLLGAKYRGFIGDFAFVDTQGTDDPFFTGLGTRYLLYYIGVDE